MKAKPCGSGNVLVIKEINLGVTTYFRGQYVSSVLNLLNQLMIKLFTTFITSPNEILCDTKEKVIMKYKIAY